jgi:hypothetical protein
MGERNDRWREKTNDNNSGGTRGWMKKIKNENKWSELKRLLKEEWNNKCSERKWIDK